MKRNPTQWPSFDNLSVWYAERCIKRIEMLSVPVILIQRWWRQRNKPRKHQKLYPIIIIGGRSRSYNVKSAQSFIRDSNGSRLDSIVLSKHVYAFEKLDGTNVGIRCDGAKFGRRLQIFDTKTYQKCQLDVLPDVSLIQAIKNELANLVGKVYNDNNDKDNDDDMPQFILYGELMCNPGRYKYNERGLGKIWRCFGAMFAPYKKQQDNVNNDTTNLQRSIELAELLENKGILASVSHDSGKITCRLNDKLCSIIEQHGIKCVPFAHQGPLCNVCFELKNVMMQNSIEGYVLSGSNFLCKWKTGKEDESKGHDLLSSLLKRNSSIILDYAGVDKDFAECLAEVAGNKTAAAAAAATTTGKQKKSVVQKPPKERRPYSEEELMKAIESAMTKYDSLATYFANNQRDEIIEILKTEVQTDLNASNNDNDGAKMKCVQRFVTKYVGKAYGSFLKTSKLKAQQHQEEEEKEKDEEGVKTED